MRAKLHKLSLLNIRMIIVSVGVVVCLFWGLSGESLLGPIGVTMAASFGAREEDRSTDHRGEAVRDAMGLLS